jgi:transcription elongation factor Elf1
MANGDQNVRIIECPQCDTPQEVVPVTVLHPDDEALRELFAGTLNVVSCANCGVRFALNIPILFRDDQEQYLVYFMPLDTPSEWRDAEKKMAELTAKIFAAEPGVEEPTCRLTVRRSEFIEKIALHFRGFDDRLVEYMKYQLINHPDERFGLDAMRHRLLFDFSLEDDENLAFIVFDRETDEATARTHVPLETYQEIAEVFLQNEDLNEELSQLFPGAYVSLERLNA